MESLSDIMKSMPKGSFLRDAEQKIEQVLSHPLINKLKANHPELDERTLKVNMNRLYQHVTDYSHCSKCPGLDKCPNDLTGHYTRLKVETINDITYIHDQKVACKKFIARQKEDAIRKRVRSFYIDENSINQRYSPKEIVEIDPNRSEAVESVFQYIVTTKKKGLQKQGLYLVGSFGAGKTYLMGYMLHELSKIGLSGTIVYMPEFVEDLKAMIHQDPHKIKETIDMLKDTDLLIFDDIGAENLNPWARDHVMGTILNYRMNRKPTFYTSNHDLNALELHFSFTNKDGEEEYKGRRIMDRIRPFVETIGVHGFNKRGMTKG